VEVFAKKAIAGIEAGKLEVRPGVANVMKILSRICSVVHTQAGGEDDPVVRTPALNYRSQALYPRKVIKEHAGEG